MLEMKIIEQELYELYKKYINYDLNSIYTKISETNTNNKFSKGIGFDAGLYEPSYVWEMRVTNCTIGKEVKKPENGFEYKYYFDENNKILLSEKYLSGRLSYINFYFYLDGTIEFIQYSCEDKKITIISKSFYDEQERITRYIAAPNLYRDFYNNTEEHIFRYENEVTYITQIEYFHPTKSFIFSEERTEITNMKVLDNVLYYLDDNQMVESFYPIRFKLVDGRKVNVSLPKRVPVFKIIKESMVKILEKWKDINKSVIWINCESLDLEMQYTTLNEDTEEKWNIAFYDSNEEKIFKDTSHRYVLEDLLINNGCNIDDLINESNYFVKKMIKIIKELRREEYILDNTAVILSDLEISDNTLNIAKKVNHKDTIKGFFAD
ncbi:MAG: hypothetical protein PHO87_04745 [Acholeplasmataceae bacterium]|nr:hypothetical protein [Acholeplasmataceae bacterium]